MAGRVIPALAEQRGRAFFQEFLPSAWLVANLTLRERPPGTHLPPGLGQRAPGRPGPGLRGATHQSLRDHGPTVWTFYHALAGRDMRADWELAPDHHLAASASA